MKSVAKKIKVELSAREQFRTRGHHAELQYPVTGNLMLHLELKDDNSLHVGLCSAPRNASPNPLFCAAPECHIIGQSYGFTIRGEDNAVRRC